MKRCVIIGAVEIDFPVSHLIKETDFVICADKGWQNAAKRGIRPDMIVGDFDSSPYPENAEEAYGLLLEKLSALPRTKYLVEEMQ